MKLRLNLTRILSALSVLFFISCEHVPGTTGSNKEIDANKKSVRAVYDMFETGNTSNIEDYVHSDMIEHTPDPAVYTKGIQGLKDIIQINRTAFPDLKFTVYRIAGEGNMIFSHFNIKGTNTGNLVGIEASGRKIDVDGVDVLLFRDGKISEHWGYWDTRKFIEQMGGGH